jgi:general secretion pathway protein H
LALPRRRAAGFTLIELLVVLVVIGIAAGAVTFGIGGGERSAAEREAKRLAGALEHAAALAQWRSETLGVSAEGAGYRFWRRGSDDQWRTLADDDVLAPRVLPGGITVAPVSYAGAPVAADAILPFRASGRNEPYALLLTSSAWPFTVGADPLNRVSIAAPADSR